MPDILNLDIETFSSEDLLKTGVYRYVESIDFEILLIAYSINKTAIKIVDLCSGETMPPELHEALLDPTVEKHAQNAIFERVCFSSGRI